MAATDVRKFTWRHTAHGDKVLCQIIDYEAGRDAGDHLCFGAASEGEKAHGAGDTFRDWLVVGNKRAGTIEQP